MKILSDEVQETPTKNPEKPITCLGFSKLSVG